MRTVRENGDKRTVRTERDVSVAIKRNRHLLVALFCKRKITSEQPFFGRAVRRNMRAPLVSEPKATTRMAQDSNNHVRIELFSKNDFAIKRPNDVRTFPGAIHKLRAVCGEKAIAALAVGFALEVRMDCAR